MELKNITDITHQLDAQTILEPGETVEVEHLTNGQVRRLVRLGALAVIESKPAKQAASQAPKSKSKKVADKTEKPKGPAVTAAS